MKKLSFLVILLAGLMVFSCQKKQPDFVNSIPDDAFLVVSMQPMQIHKKGQLNTLENLKAKIKQDVLKKVLDDPLSSGLMMDEYAYMFVTMETESPRIGVVAGMNNLDKFETMLNSIDEKVKENIVEKDGFKMVSPDEEGVIGWNEKQMIMLIQPDNGKDEEAWATDLATLFDLPKEESITSMVDFNDFTGKMKDLNFWMSSDKMRELIENLEKMNSHMNIKLPVTFYNNYAQLYCEFDNGAVKVTGETHFSEEVEKNVEEYLVMKNSLNKDLLELAPGDNLLLATAASMDIKKLQKVMKDMAPPEVGEIGNKIEQATGVPAEEIWQALTGDFVLSVNGLEGESMIPVELFIGLGLDNEALQDTLMGTVKNMAQVEQEGDFFVINVQGMEIYSGIVNGIWVLTNAKGYREAVKGSGLKDNLANSKFEEFADKSMGMYLNLDLSTYPSMIQQQLSKNPEQQDWIEYLTSSFNYLGMSSGNYNSDMILKTKKPDENSLYTIMKMVDMK